MPSFITYFHTLRFLKPIQIVGRIWIKIYAPKIKIEPALELRSYAGKWTVPAKRKQSLFLPFSFKFLNEVHVLHDAVDWDKPEISKLWRYNLHYFDDLNSIDAGERYDQHLRMLERWVIENKPGYGTGWEPYPTSLRIVNWIKWFLSGAEPQDIHINSLAVQARWLYRRLEWHILGNHLFANAKALVFAGLFFQGHEAEKWLQKGLQILEQEIPEQILADGGQFERSTMYHALALEDMLDLYNVIRTYMSYEQQVLLTSWKELINRMRTWLKVMCHPDNEISFFNDSAMGIAPEPNELDTYAHRLGFQKINSPGDSMTYLKESGYLRVDNGVMSAFLDLAPVGPDYLPGHAHADTLSFELSIFGQRFLVNTGTSKYGNDLARHKQRSTAAHNTVSIDDQDSSEVWAGFRVARRAKPGKPSISQSNTFITITCDHDGYKRLPGKCVHTRQWQFSENQLSVCDEITGKFNSAIARYYIHPDIQVTNTPDKVKEFEVVVGGEKKIQISIEGADSVELLSSCWHPEFGIDQGNQCIAAEFTGSQLTTNIKILHV